MIPAEPTFFYLSFHLSFPFFFLSLCILFLPFSPVFSFPFDFSYSFPFLFFLIYLSFLPFFTFLFSFLFSWFHPLLSLCRLFFFCFVVVVVVVVVFFFFKCNRHTKLEKKGGGCVRRWSLLHDCQYNNNRCLKGRANLFFLPILVFFQAFTYGMELFHGSYLFAEASFYC